MAYNILVVDDSTTVRAVLAKTLELAHIPVNQLYQAANGRQALGILQETWIDLVLTDINMPVMDGMELVREMAGDGLLRQVPVVVISTEGSEVRIAELKQQGIQGYIRKPFTPEQVKEVVEHVLGN
ncbi:MAG: response regulator [Candidatus Latescibacteria bacterium]|nr:response regulator [Candidatus Latescibacterota bacterium]